MERRIDFAMRRSRINDASNVPIGTLHCHESVAMENRIADKRRRCFSFTATLFILVASLSQCESYMSASSSPAFRRTHSQSRTFLSAVKTKSRRQKRDVSRDTIRINKRDASFDPVRQHNAMTQFTPRYLKYERDKVRGTQKGDGYVDLTDTKKPGPSKEEQQHVTKKIAHLLSEETDQDEEDDDDLLLGDIADRQTVNSLSDADKSQATYAVSKAKRDKGTQDLEPSRLMMGRGATRKGKVTANVLETGQDTMKQYVKSMGQHQVLSKQDEEVLGRQIQILTKWEAKRQDLEEELLRAPTFAEWAEALDTTVPALKKQVRRSQKAKAALVEANLRFVVTVARQTVKSGRSEINFQDACQEGMIGLVRACEKFEPGLGNRFSSYAVWWIKKMIHANVSQQSRQVHLPARVMRKINDIRIQEKVLQDELGRKPRDSEVAEKVGITVEKLEFYRKSANDVISLDKKIKFKKEGDGNNTPEFHSIVKDPSQSPTEMVNKQMLKEDVRSLLRTLSPKEQVVIRMRFGLDSGPPRTLEEIGHKFSVDKERIRKIEVKALRKLRQPYRSQSLQCYVSEL